MSLIIIFLSISPILFSLLFLHRKHLAHFSYPNLPPGKAGMPLIGESFSFLSAGRQGRQEKFITDRVHRFSSSGVFKTHIFGSPTAVVTGASGNKFLFTNENKLVVSWWPDSVNKIFPSSSTEKTNSKEEAKKLRTILVPFLKPEALRRHVGVMDEIANRHFETEWANQDQLIVFPLTKKFTFSVVCRSFLSMEDPERVKKLEEPFKMVSAGILSVPIDLPGTRFNRAIKASRLLRKKVSEIVRLRKEQLKAGKASAEHDILSHMLVSIGDMIKDEDVADKIIGLLIAGYDTSSIVCTFVVSFLAEFPHVYERVLQEQMEILKGKEGKERLRWEDIEKMRYSWNVACEVMRMVPPLSGTFREAIDHFSFKGFYIPKGWKLYWSAIATHKNPDYFPEPERFEPSRFEGNGPKPYTYVPFGGGPRMCPGREYARLEILIFMHHLVKRFKWEKVFPNENKIVVDPLPVPAKGLPIRLFPQSCVKV